MRDKTGVSSGVEDFEATSVDVTVTVPVFDLAVSQPIISVIAKRNEEVPLNHLYEWILGEASGEAPTGIVRSLGSFSEFGSENVGSQLRPLA